MHNNSSTHDLIQLDHRISEIYRRLALCSQNVAPIASVPNSRVGRSVRGIHWVVMCASSGAISNLIVTIYVADLCAAFRNKGFTK
jgi:hypothetical protein